MEVLEKGKDYEEETTDDPCGDYTCGCVGCNDCDVCDTIGGDDD